MARARNIKPGFFKNEDLAECCMEARLCFAGLWCLADREGRLEDRPKRIKGELFAFDSVEVEPLLQQLADRGFILRYRAGDQALIQIVNFAKHQSPHYKEGPTTYPAPVGWRASSAQKPEAEGPIKEAEASGVTANDQAGSGADDRGVSRSDSLIPDSLIPDSFQESAQRSAPKTRIPLTWQPSESLKSWASNERPDLDLKNVIDDFRDYWLAKGETRANWEASFRTWVRKERKPASYRGVGNASSHHDGFSQIDHAKGVHADGSFA